MQVEPAQVEGHDRTGNGAGDDPAAVVAQQRHQLLDPGATSDVGHRIEPGGQGRSDLLGQIAGVPGDDVSRAGGSQRSGLRAAGDGHDSGAAGRGQLHQRQPDAAGGTGDQHRLTLPQPCSFEHAHRGSVGHRQARELLVAQRRIADTCACGAGTTT